MSEVSLDHEAFRGLPVYDAAGTRALDACAIETHGVPGYTLMTRAAMATFRCLRTRWARAAHVTVVCGAGNNAGDGYVIARLAREAGLDVTVQYCVAPDRLRGDAARAWQDHQAAGGEAIAFDGELAPADVVVDALLGTGLDRDVTGAFSDAVEAMNAADADVLAVDIPSGLQADTGRIMGCAVQAAATVTFIGRKAGLFTASGPACTGDVIFDDLAVPPEIYADVAPTASLVTLHDLVDWLAPRPRDGHKGTFGLVSVLGGDRGMPGAVQLCGEAALRAGAGMVKAGTHDAHADLVPLRNPALMSAAVADEGAVTALLAWADVIALGPGLGQSEWSRMVYEAALAHRGPLVLDADALNLLAAEPRRRDDWILTPHPGEASRLLGCSTRDVQADRFAAAGAIRERFGGACILKGAGTVIAAGDLPIICADGNPGMATAGMGDVLTGVVAAMLAQGLKLDQAAVTAACAHAAAGDRAARDGERGMTAPDVIAALRATVNPGRR